jgi:hypothetical protein
METDRARQALGKLLNIAVELAHGDWMPNLAACRTMRQARNAVSCSADKHGELAIRLKSVWDELQQYGQSEYERGQGDAATTVTARVQSMCDALLAQLRALPLRGKQGTE